jgi:hypothetical protein
MTELERALASLAADVDWPPTPRFEPLELVSAAQTAPPPSRRRRRALVLAIAVALVALGVALAVPQARSAIFRFLHVGGVTVERVATLPAAEERELAADLGTPISTDTAEALLGGPVVLPETNGTPMLYGQGSIVSVVLATPEPVLLSQVRSSDGVAVMKKVAGSETGTEWVELAPDVYGLWITGRPHVVFFPDAPPRLAGNVLLWERDGVTFRLEGPELTRESALLLARELLGVENG